MEDLAKSVFLSTGRYDDHEAQEVYRPQLEQLAARLQSGVSINYPAEELERLREKLGALLAVGPWQVWDTVFRLFLPAFGLVGVLVLLYALLR